MIDEIPKTRVAVHDAARPRTGSARLLPGDKGAPVFADESESGSSSSNRWLCPPREETMTDDFVDPGTPGDVSSAMKAKDLLNKPCLIRPNELRHDGKGKDNDGNDKSYTYVSCDVWVLDRAGIVEEGNNVHISWVRSVPQLTDRLGSFVAATPRRGDDNSITLEAFTDAGKDIARSAIKEIKSRVEAPEAPESNGWEAGDPDNDAF